MELQSPAFLFLVVLMAAVAFLYASVGHGGASSYLMLLSLFGFAPDQIRPLALLLNIMVAATAWWSYRKVAPIRTELFIPLILFAVPAAFAGARISIDAETYRRILGCLLLFPALRILVKIPERTAAVIPYHYAWAIIAGALIGFLSGMIGIGGGILLSPLLLLLGWAGMKETATMSALFIVLNSMAGLFSSWQGDMWLSPSPSLLLLFLLTLAAGFAGAVSGAQRFTPPALRYLLSIVLVIASIKFIIG